MTETEKLKEEADKQRAIQRHEAVTAYIKRLTDQLDREAKDVSDSIKVGMLSLIPFIAVIVASFFVKSPLLIAAFFGAFTLNWILMMRTQNFIHKARRTVSELDGCFNTLELLGFLERGERSPRKKKESVLEKVWAKAKGLTMRKPYGQPVSA